MTTEEGGDDDDGEEEEEEEDDDGKEEAEMVLHVRLQLFRCRRPGGEEVGRCVGGPPDTIASPHHHLVSPPSHQITHCVCEVRACSVISGPRVVGRGVVVVVSVAEWWCELSDEHLIVTDIGAAIRDHPPREDVVEGVGG